jgi:DNA-directed RNA polymerase subunit RPC12/RpoP
MTFRIERPEGGVGDYERVHKVCVTCGDEFKDKPRNLGLITQCDGCGAKREVPVLKGFTEVEGSKGTTRTVVPVTPDVFDRAVKQARTGSVRTN